MLWLIGLNVSMFLLIKQAQLIPERQCATEDHPGHAIGSICRFNDIFAPSSPRWVVDYTAAPVAPIGRSEQDIRVPSVVRRRRV
jgi:hypothetical protein